MSENVADRKFKILSAEDQELDFQRLRQALEMAEVQIDSLVHGRSAKETLELCEANFFDIIFLDYSLPDGNGISVLKKIKEISPESIIIFVTGNSCGRLTSEALRNGAQDYIGKGELSSSLLKRVIGHSIERHALVCRLTKRERDLESLNKKLDLASNAKSEFLSNMSHEIRTPLNLVLGMSDLLSKTKLDDVQRRYTEAFQKGSRHLLNLISDILDLSKIEAGEYQIVKTAFNLNDLIEDIADISALVCRGAKLGFSYHVSEDLKDTVVSDPKVIRQVLLNIINNAVKFTESGEIQLIVGVADTDVTMREQTIKVEIKDTGCGISEKDRERIFGKFLQSDNSTSKKFQGTGLGLAIVKGLVAKLDGRLQVSSKLGKGTSFNVEIPVNFIPERRQTRLEQLKGESFVVACTNSLELVTIRQSLESEGGKIEEILSSAEDLSNFLNQVSTPQPHNLIIDFQLLDKGSLEVLEKREFSGNDWGSVLFLLPVIHRIDDISRLRGVGVENILIKPLKRNQFLDSLIPRLKSPLSDKTTNYRQAGLSKKRVLIVEDDIDNRFLFAEYLKGQGHEITFAKNGLEGIEKFKESSEFDVVFMDIQMPEIDGYEATDQIRAIEKDRGLTTTPILALTANAFQEHLEKAKAVGFNGFLPKPILQETLLEALEDYAQSFGQRQFYSPTFPKF